MAKQGIFDTSSRKIVGVLDEIDTSIVEVNGQRISLPDALEAYKGCEITVTVGETSETLPQE